MWPDLCLNNMVVERVLSVQNVAWLYRDLGASEDKPTPPRRRTRGRKLAQRVAYWAALEHLRQLKKYDANRR